MEQLNWETERNMTANHAKYAKTLPQRGGWDRVCLTQPRSEPAPRVRSPRQAERNVTKQAFEVLVGKGFELAQLAEIPPLATKTSEYRGIYRPYAVEIQRVTENLPYFFEFKKRERGLWSG